MFTWSHILDPQDQRRVRPDVWARIDGSLMNIDTNELVPMIVELRYFLANYYWVQTILPRLVNQFADNSNVFSSLASPLTTVGGVCDAES